MKINLINEETGEVVNVGDIVTTFRGEQKTLKAVYPHDGKTGKVQLGSDDFSRLLYPSVIGCTFVQEGGK